MFVGVIKIDMFLPACLSLKMKRGIIKSIKQRIRNKFNVSIAEIDNSLGVSIISNETKLIDSVCTEIMKFINSDGRAEILEHSINVF